MPRKPLLATEVTEITENKKSFICAFKALCVLYGQKDIFPIRWCSVIEMGAWVLDSGFWILNSLVIIPA